MDKEHLMELLSNKSIIAFTLFPITSFFLTASAHTALITYTPTQSNEIAMHGTRAVRLGECVALGAQAKVATKRLQILANNFSKESDVFLAAFDKGNITKEASDHVPMIWGSLLNDYHTSYEFVKGALWNSLQEQARKEYSDGINPNQTWEKYSNALKNSAALIYNDKNCELLE